MKMQYKIYYVNAFYLFDDIVEHSLSTVTIIEVLAGLGGLHRILMIIFKEVSRFFNSRILTAKFIRNMYFIKSKKLDYHEEDNFDY